MNPELGIALYQQMDMVRHDFQLHSLCLMLLAYLSNDSRQAICYAFHEHLTPILGTPDHVILTRVGDVPVRFVSFCTHENSIQYQAISCQRPTLPRLPRHLKAKASSIPTPKATGFH